MLIDYLHRTQAKGVEGVHIGEIVRAWRRLGHEVRVVSPVGEGAQAESTSGKPAPPSWKKRLLSGLSKRLPEVLFELAEIAYNLVAIKQLFGHRHRKPDFIFERYAIFAFAGAWMAARWKIPFIIEVNYTSQSALVRKRSHLMAPLARAVDRYVFRHATGLAAVSSQLKAHLVTDYGIPESRVIVLPNAADPEVFDPSKVDVNRDIAAPGEKLIGFVGGFYPWHGVGYLLEAFRQLADAIPKAKLLLVGDGPMRASIAADAERLGISHRIIMTGQIDHRRLPGYVRAFHIGVMPDSNDYGSPMKIFEYMSLAMPVVVPDYGPLRDVVTDGREGRIFKARDVDALAACLRELLTDDDAHSRMSENARLAILERHNWLENSRRILGFLPEQTA